uniref:cell surface glycoprotein 1-like n=1 Tax=Styela clava TaxID=7725 RepID=UPI00193A0D4C|nr:cell surface glycoprotein 1-like [Styela clava]
MTKASAFIALVALAVSVGGQQTYPWVNDFIACVAKMPIFDEEPILLESGTYMVGADKTEFRSGEMMTFFVDGKEPTEKFRGLFISVLENGRAVGEWMPSNKFMMRGCDGAQNSAMTERNTEEKFVKNDMLKWKAPNCKEDKNYKISATVIKSSNIFERGITMNLKCMASKPVPMSKQEDLSESKHKPAPEFKAVGEPKPEGEQADKYRENKPEPESKPEGDPKPEGEHDDKYNKNKPEPESKPEGEPTPEGEHDDKYNKNKLEQKSKPEDEPKPEGEHDDKYRKNKPEPESNPEGEPRPEGEHADKYNKNKPEPESNPEGEPKPEEEHAGKYNKNKPEPESNPEGEPKPEEEHADKYNKNKPEPESNPEGEPKPEEEHAGKYNKNRPEPESNPEGELKPEGKHDDKYNKNKPEPESKPEGEPKPEGEHEAKYRKNKPEPDYNPEGEPNPEGGHADKYRKNKPEPESKPEGEPKPEGEHDAKYRKNKQELESKPEGEPKPEGEHADKYRKNKPEPESNPEREPKPESEHAGKYNKNKTEPESKPEGEPKPEGEHADKYNKNKPEPEGTKPEKMPTPERSTGFDGILFGEDEDIIFGGGFNLFPGRTPSGEPTSKPKPEDSDGEWLLDGDGYEKNVEPEGEPKPKGENWDETDEEYTIKKTMTNPTAEKSMVPEMGLLFPDDEEEGLLFGDESLIPKMQPFAKMTHTGEPALDTNFGLDNDDDDDDDDDDWLLGDWYNVAPSSEGEPKPEEEPKSKGEDWAEHDGGGYDKKGKSKPEPEKQSKSVSVPEVGGEPKPEVEPKPKTKPQSKSGDDEYILEDIQNSNPEPQPEKPILSTGLLFLDDDEELLISDSLIPSMQTFAKMTPEGEPTPGPILFGFEDDDWLLGDAYDLDTKPRGDAKPEGEPKPEGEQKPVGEAWNDHDNNYDKKDKSKHISENKNKDSEMKENSKPEPEPEKNTKLKIPENPAPESKDIYKGGDNKHTGGPEPEPETKIKPKKDPKPAGEVWKEHGDIEKSKPDTKPHEKSKPKPAITADPEDKDDKKYPGMSKVDGGMKTDPEPEPEDKMQKDYENNSDMMKSHEYVDSDSRPEPDMDKMKSDTEAKANTEQDKTNKYDGVNKPSPEGRPMHLKPLGLNALKKCKNPMFDIPMGATTSFERHDFGAWRNNTSGDLMWLPNMGKTPSPNTGPDWAFDGQNYLYMEGSRPAKYGHKAILKGPKGLRGCFCIRFACHMMVDPKTTIALLVNGETVNSNGFSHMGWQEMVETVDMPGESMIEIVATRGTTFRGDVAIDNIRVTPGMCIEDM